MKTVIECKNLYHSYGKTAVLKNLDFAINKGSVLGLLGKNGAGKTTAINILMGFLQPTGGHCSVMGEASHAIHPAARKKIGLLHEGFLQYEFMTIAQAEKFYSQFYPQWKRELYYNLIDKMGLQYNHRIAKMSCGQRSQVTLGLIFAQDPELFILDDYSLGLDAGYRRLLLDFLKDHIKKTNKTVLVTSHIVQDLEKFVEEIIILDKGSVLVQSSLDEFMNTFSRYSVEIDPGRVQLSRDRVITQYDIIGSTAHIYSFEPYDVVKAHLEQLSYNTESFQEEAMSLEDAFIGITGKY
jgi:ABC-2 type transport system ATP-binding protein